MFDSDNIEIIAFDFDGTLCKPNTTLDFLKYYFNKKKLGAKLKFHLTWIYAKVLKDVGIINPNQYTRFRLTNFRGENAIKVQLEAQEYISSLVQNQKINIDLLTTINHHLLNRKTKIVILSYGLDFIIQAFCSYYKLNVIVLSSSLKRDNKIFTGRYDLDLVATGKHIALQKEFSKEQISKAVYYSDDPEADGPIVNKVARFIKVSS